MPKTKGRPAESPLRYKLHLTVQITQDAWLVDTLSVDEDRRLASAHTTTLVGA